MILLTAKQRAFAIVVALLIVAASGWIWQHDSDQPLDKVGAIHIAASLTVSPATIWVAQEQGLFAKAGLDATLQDCSTGKSCTEAMLKGEANLAAATEFLATRVALGNKDLRILGTTAFVHTIKLQARKDKDIKQLADLRGKRVGVKLGTNGEYFLARLLILNGMNRDDITWVDLKPQAMTDALAADEVDAVLVWPPFTSMIRGQLGENLVEFDGQPGQDYYYLVLGRQDWLAANSKIAERVMLALKWANEWMHAHPEETKTFMASKFGVPLTDMAEDMQNTRFAIGLPQALLSALEAESRWLQKQGAKETPIANSLNLIDFAPLTAVAPETVTMIHNAPLP